MGDPALPSVIVTDVGTDVAHFPTQCGACGRAIGGAALHIQRNVIVAAWAFRPGELRPDLPAIYYTVAADGALVQIPASKAEPWQIVDCYVEQEDGTWRPMPEWEFRGCDYIEP